MVGEFLDLENLLFFLGMFDNLHSRVELPAHYHQVLRLCQGVDGGPGAKRTCLVLCPL